MRTKELLELLAEAGHVAELARLLSGFSRRRMSRLGKVELVELANQTAGATYRYPTPEPALKVALAVGLLHRAGNIISLTATGMLFLKLQGDRKLDLSFEQASLLLGLLMDDAPMAQHIAWLMRQFGQGSSGRLETKTSPPLWDESAQTTAKILQQLGILEQHATKLAIGAAFESVLPPNLLEVAALTEEALWERLEAQRIRAREAEELALVEERKRLVRVGRSDLAELVVRISAENVSAGYDIESFEHDASPRLIEVKSSVGRTIRFDWSVREREVASKNRDHYWIYFVPLATALKNRTLPIFMIRNPVAHIRAGTLMEAPLTYTVCARRRVSPSAERKSGKHETLIEWLVVGSRS